MYREILAKICNRSSVAVAACFVTVFWGALVSAQEYVHGPQPARTNAVKQLDKANIEKYKNASDILVLPGLIANRKEKRVEVYAEATGLREGPPVEFLLIDHTSAHGYEALLWSYAKPSHVHAALEFIGLEAGEPFDPEALRFWCKGPMVDVSVVASNQKPVMLESLTYDRNTDESSPAEGFVFTGSIMLPPQGQRTEAAYAADLYDPKVALSLFNTSTTVLNVPRQASQTETYGSNIVNPAHALKHGTLLTLVMVPRGTNAQARTSNLELVVGISESSAKRTNTVSTGKLEFRLQDASGQALGTDKTLKSVLETLADLLGKAGLSTYLSISFEDEVGLQDVRKTCVMMGLLERGSGLKIEPPPEGQLYYKAFLPDDRWRDRDKRMAQPWELHLGRKDDKVVGKLVFNQAILGKDGSDKTFIVKSNAVASPEDVRAILDDDAKAREEAGKPAGLPVLLVLAGEGITYGDLMEYLKPALSTHHLVHIFLEPKRIVDP